MQAISKDAFAAQAPAVTGGFSQTQDKAESATAPRFGEVLKEMHAKYGAKPAKPREVKKTLGKDDFLRIMITQMKNQDPTNPFKAEQMASEIAQFTSVEQLQNVNQNLNKMATQNRPLEQMAMTNLIGKMVTVDRERFPHMEGQSDTLNFNLSKDAAQLKISILGEQGETVFEKDMGAKDAGDVNFIWDGIKSTSLPAKTGKYLYRVNATDARGQVIPINPKVRAQVIGVSFEGGEPVFLVGTAKHQDRVTMQNISMIETNFEANDSKKIDSSGQNQGPARESSSAPPAPQLVESPPTQNFFKFRPGEGSETIEGAQQSKVLEDFKAQQELKAKMDRQAQNEAQEKGFPNGLGDPDEVSSPPDQIRGAP